MGLEHTERLTAWESPLPESVTRKILPRSKTGVFYRKERQEATYFPFSRSQLTLIDKGARDIAARFLSDAALLKKGVDSLNEADP